MLYANFKIIAGPIRLILFMIYVTGCASNASDSSGSVSVARLDNNVDLNNSVLVKQQLLGHYNEWRGTRYKTGGLSLQGVDCSGFIYITFRSKLGLDIPRTTELQLKIGSDIARVDLRAGDLIFFKTGFFTRHIGVYLGNGQFMHASSSHGVMISSLNNKYWQSKYWLSRRLET